jgi:predicted Rossmann fold flavoprotein
MMGFLTIETIDVLVIGGGAAGLMCAIEAGRRGRSVIVLERSGVIGTKIRISGGGRCNFTNIHTSPENFISENHNFHKSALARYTPDDFLRLVQRHKIAYHEKKRGQLFCDGTAEQIIKMLLKESHDAGARIRCSSHVDAVRRKDGGFTVVTRDCVFQCTSLVVATGGLSIPKAGATDFGYRLARQFGLRVTETCPALVPLTLNDPEGGAFRNLSGVSMDVSVTCNRVTFREHLLFTHRGLSGPAILQISSYWRPGDSIIIDAMPDANVPLPRRFLRKWQEIYGEPATAKSERLRQWRLTPNGSEGFAKAEVTRGGVDTRELSSKTMEASRMPGLYFIGEVVDVTGHLGGFNFQWAWASGFAAGQYV